MNHVSKTSMLCGLAILAFAGCGGTPVPAPSKTGVAPPTVPAVPEKIRPAATVLEVRPVEGLKEFFELHQASRDSRPEMLGWTFSGPPMLLHVWTYEDLSNAQGWKHRLPNLPETAEIREMHQWCVLGPFPMNVTSTADWAAENTLSNGPKLKPEDVTLSIERKALLERGEDDLRLTFRQSIRYGSAKQNGSSAFTLWRGLAYGVVSEQAWGTIPRVAMADIKAASQPDMFYNPQRTAGTSTGDLSRPLQLTAGESQSIAWKRRGPGEQVVVIAECLPFTTPISTDSLRQDVAGLSSKLANKSNDVPTQYHLAWAKYLLAEQPKLTIPERRELLGQAVELSRGIVKRQPANFAARSALRVHLVLFIAYLENDDVPQAKALVAELLAQQPTFHECLDAARFVGKSDLKLSNEERLELMTQLLTFGLESVSGSPELTLACVNMGRSFLKNLDSSTTDFATVLTPFAQRAEASLQERRKRSRD